MATIVVPTAAPSGAERCETGSFEPTAMRAFAFGAFVLRPERQSLVRDGAPVRIGGRGLDILTALVERAGRLVDKRELLARVWPDTCVEEANLKVNIAMLRRLLGETPAVPRYIATVVGRGYRFIAPVRQAESPESAVGDDRSVEAARIAGMLDAIEAIRRQVEDGWGYASPERRRPLASLADRRDAPDTARRGEP